MVMLCLSLNKHENPFQSYGLARNPDQPETFKMNCFVLKVFQYDIQERKKNRKPDRKPDPGRTGKFCEEMN